MGGGGGGGPKKPFSNTSLEKRVPMGVGGNHSLKGNGMEKGKPKELEELEDHYTKCLRGE